MSVFDKMKSAMENHDAGAFIDLLHDDFVFVRHQSGTNMNRTDMARMVEEMSGSEGWSVENHRCIYENGDIMVEHSVMKFPDGTKEAVLAVNTLKDGKITRLETGATKLD